MAVVIVPLRTDVKNYRQRITIEGIVYNFRLLFNSRDNAWYLDIADEDGSDILNGRRIVSNFDLLSAVPGIDRPPGKLVALNAATVSPMEPSENTLGADIPLLYIEATS